MHALRLMSYKKLHVLLSMMNFKIISFPCQAIYRNRQCFRRAMRDLKKRGFVNSRINGNGKLEYKLTEKGQKWAVALNELAE